MSLFGFSRVVDRLCHEEAALRDHLPQFRVYDLHDPGRAFVSGWERSPANQYDYQLSLIFPSGYPDEMPLLYILQPRPLYCYDGAQLPELSHSFHTWGSGSNGQTQICHCHRDEWDPWRSCVAVMLRSLLWISLFERHLRTGRTIDDLFEEIERSIT